MARHNTSEANLPALPVRDCLPALDVALAAGHAVLTAEPGSGKTTLVPLLLRDAAWLGGLKILVLEPRRPAARMAARRMAALLGEAVGNTVGFQVRFERQVSAATRIEVLTEGLLQRRLQADPALSGVGLVIFDEFHERHLQGDLGLALCLDVCAALRDDLRLLVMSAALDSAALASLMGAQVISGAGRSYPVEVHYADADADLRRPEPACLQALGRALEGVRGDVLVFLPGRAEIARMREQVLAQQGEHVDVHTLYGDMPADAQDAVITGRGTRRRVILATDIAETSLTIEGIEAVVDSGLARKPSFDPGTGLTRLKTCRISRASALQRAGRAGRLGPGQCFRAWTPARQARLEEFAPPEIVDADLAPLVLELADWGVADPGTLSWLDAPPPAHWARAVELLSWLGALDGQAHITPVGRCMARLPTHPRLAHMLVAAGDGCGLAADLAALLSERDPFARVARDMGSDIGVRLDALAALRDGRALPPDTDRRVLQQVERVAAQLARAVDGGERSGVSASMAPGRLLALAYPDRVALRSGGDGRRYLMRNGRAAVLDAADPLCGQRLLVIAALDAGERDARVWLAASLDSGDFDALFGDTVECQREVRWDAARGDVVARRVRRLDGLVLDDVPVALAADDPVVPVLVEVIRSRGLAAYFDDPVGLRARVALMRRVEPDAGWPDCSEPALLDSLDQWLPSWLAAGEGVRGLRRIDLAAVVTGMLGWDAVQRLDRALPTHFATPAGTRRPIEYPIDGEPLIALPLQEVLGLAEGPRLADGRVVPVLHLLSPAGRPLQVTRDLAAFWAGAYAEVKKEMRGRYPRHYWPDDPAAAQATRFTKRRMQQAPRSD